MEKLLDRLPKGMGNVEVIQRELYQLDSANAQPHHWQILASSIKEISKEIPGSRFNYYWWFFTTG